MSDASYGDPSLVFRGKREGSVMAGWESCRHSARHRLGIALAHPSVVRRLEIDTYLHCLNPFRFMSVLACNSTGACHAFFFFSLFFFPVQFHSCYSLPTHFSQIYIYILLPAESTEKLLASLPGWRVTLPGKEAQEVADAEVNEFLEKHGNMTCPGPVRYQLALAAYRGPWKVLLPTSPLQRDTLHEYEKHLKEVGPVTHLVFLGVPDGGVHRIGVYGDRA